MLNKIRQYFLSEKLKSRLKDILALLYSEAVYTTDEIISSFKVSNNNERLQYLIGIQIACELKPPYTDGDIEKFKNKYEENILLASSSKEVEERILVINNDLTQALLEVFNSWMTFQKSLRNDNQYSRQGIMLNMMYAKGRPLTKPELQNADFHYRNIKNADDKYLEVQKKVEDFLKGQ